MRKHRYNSLECRVLMHLKHRKYTPEKLYLPSEAGHRTQYYTIASLADTTLSASKRDIYLSKSLLEIVDIHYETLHKVLDGSRPNHFLLQNIQKYYIELRLNVLFTKVLHNWSNLMTTVLPKSLILLLLSTLLLLLPFIEEIKSSSSSPGTLCPFSDRIRISIHYYVIITILLYFYQVSFYKLIHNNISNQRICSSLVMLVPIFIKNVIL